MNNASDEDRESATAAPEPNRSLVLSSRSLRSVSDPKRLTRFPAVAGGEASRETSAAHHTTESLRADEILQRLDALRNQGQAWLAHLGYRDLVQQLDKLADPSPTEQALRLGAARRELETAWESGPVEETLAGFADSLAAWFRQDHWRQRRAQVVEHFRWLIQTELRVGRRSSALELFHKARRLITLDAEVQESLARAAAELGLTDLGSAVLYLAFLQGPDQDGQTRRKILDLLRQAIRIDLVYPDEAALPEHRRLNDQLWGFREELWCAAHRAIGAWRAGNLEEAWTIRQSLSDLVEADAATLTQLGAIAYLCREWTDAAALLGRAVQARGDPPGIERLYLSLTRVNQALAGVSEAAGEEMLRDLCDKALTTLLEFPGEGAEPLDALWVRGAAYALLERDAEAMDAFAAAPPQHVGWRYAALAMESAARTGNREQWGNRLLQRAEPSSIAAAIGQLQQAAWALEDGDLDKARKQLGAVILEMPTDLVSDPDPAAVRDLLREELAFRQTEPLANVPKLGVAPQRLSATAQAWLKRLQARWHMERGELEPAAELLRAPVHRLASQRERARHEAALFALQSGREETAGRLFAELGSASTASPPDRLAHALWLCGRGEYGPAREVLAELEPALPSSLELRLARTEAELAGGNAEVARRMLSADDGRASPTELVYWTAAPRLALFRPWQHQVPVSFWPWQGKVSSHRLGDMLHGARLMIRAQMVDEALALVALAEQLLGDDRKALHPALGTLFQEASLAEMHAGRLEQACELQTRAAHCEVVDLDFAMRLAETLQTAVATPADPVLEVLCEWVAAQGNWAVAEQSLVSAALQRILHIDATTPATHLDTDRRRGWTKKLGEAQPSWEWPRRNLARAAHRAGRHEEALGFVETLSQPTADDHFLCGRSAWELERFELAATAFEASMTAGRDTPEVRAWRGCARTALRFARLREDGQALTPTEVDEFLPDLQWEAGEGDAMSRVRAWHGAALLAAGRAVEASQVLDFATEEDRLQTRVPILRGAALVQAGQPGQALAVWDGEDGPLADDLLAHSLRALALCHVLDMHQAAQVDQAVQQLVRRNATLEPFHLAVAHRALAEDRLTAAQESLSRAAGARQLPILLAPLVPWLDAERRFLEARIQLRCGQAAEARAAFGRLAQEFPWPARIRHWEALSALECGSREEAEEILAELASAAECRADAQALWALMLVRGQRLDEAEQHLARLLERAAGHPVALLARAEAKERRGNVSQAMADLRDLIEQHAAAAGPRLVAAALAALGRLEWEAGHLEAVESCLRKAADLRGNWSPAADRLAMFLAIHAQDESQRQEAARLLEQRIAVARDATPLHLAAALVADGLNWREMAAEHLRRAAQQAGFAALPAEVRRQTLTWSANLHLHLRQFGAAGRALAALGTEGLATGDRMVQCWLLQVVQSLKTTPLTPAALEEACTAATRAHEAAPTNALAALLTALCGLLRQEDNEQIQARAAGLTQHTFTSPGQSLLAAVVRHLAGDDTAVGEVETFLGQEGSAGIDRRLLALLVANQKRQPELLVAEAEGLLQTLPQPANLPWSAQDVVLVRILDQVEKKQERDALAACEAWHGAGNGTARSRQVHSQLLARQAIRLIRERELGTARRLLAEACRLLKDERDPAAPGSSSPNGGAHAQARVAPEFREGSLSTESWICTSSGMETS